jgi:perosamine synthetase
VSSELAILGGPKTVEGDPHRLWPDVRPEDKQAVLGVLDRGIFTGTGAVEVPALAADYARYVDVRHCLALNSGTAALHSCAVAVGCAPGDEVIVPALTYVASAMAMAQAGAKPVFCDVDEATYNMTPASIEERITDRTRAICVVHLHGMPCDMAEILDIAARYGLAVIEDVAQAHGALYRGQRVGTFGHCAAGSLNATKNLPGGEGGLFVTNDDELHKAARRLRYMGEDLPDPEPAEGRRYWSYGVGWNYRAQELPAAFARSQLKRLDDYNAAASRNAQILSDGLSSIPGILPPYEPEDRTSVWYIYRVRLDPEELGYGCEPVDLRDRFIHALNAEGVRAVMWQHHPLPAYEAFRRPLVPWHPSNDAVQSERWDPQEFPTAVRICNQSLVLGSGANPLAPQTPVLMERYVEAVRKIVDHVDELTAMPFEAPSHTAAARLFDRSEGTEGVPAPPVA